MSQGFICHRQEKEGEGRSRVQETTMQIVPNIDEEIDAQGRELFTVMWELGAELGV